MPALDEQTHFRVAQWTILLAFTGDVPLDFGGHGLISSSTADFVAGHPRNRDLVLAKGRQITRSEQKSARLPPFRLPLRRRNVHFRTFHVSPLHVNRQTFSIPPPGLP